MSVPSLTPPLPASWSLRPRTNLPAARMRKTSSYRNGCYAVAMQVKENKIQRTMMASAKRIYILIIETNQCSSLFSLSSFKNTCESLNATEELEKAVKTFT